MAELADKVYRNLPPPKYFLEVKGANHFSFNNRFTDKLATRLLSGSEEQFEVIRRYLIAFLEKHVAVKKDAGGVLKQQDPLLTKYVNEARCEESKKTKGLSKYNAVSLNYLTET